MNLYWGERYDHNYGCGGKMNLVDTDRWATRHMIRWVQNPEALIAEAGLERRVFAPLDLGNAQAWVMAMYMIHRGEQ